MKKFLPILVLAVLVFTAACTLFKKDIDVPQVFSIEVNQSAADPLQFTTTKEVTTLDADVEKYKEEIDEFRISKVTCKVAQFSGSNAPVVSGNLLFAAAGTSNFKTLGAVENLDLKALNLSGDEVNVPIADEQVKQELISLIKAGTNIILKLDAETTENPVVATLDFTVYATISVEL
ncbi:hypothetical protein [Botryobacter ruber]|uniref:hypothetical protein n=1 Tax=Botryobacter ruber TaxID=2171629 RepID=UPI000F64C5B3|nr:hypothetical protein [Botryobacter ruber]